MRFQCIDDVNHRLEKVLCLVRDDMPAIVPYLNDVRGIETLSREDKEDGRVQLVSLWRGSPDRAPAVVQKFLSDDLLSWKDHALWYPSGPARAEWRLEPKIGGTLFDCTGTTALLEPEPGKTQIKIHGDLKIYPEKVPGVPRILAGRLRTKIEAFVVEMIVPNLQTMARGVQNYFDDKQSGRLEQVEPDC